MYVLKENGETKGISCCYCGRTTLEMRDSMAFKESKRTVRFKPKASIIFFCYSCKRHCLALKEMIQSNSRQQQSYLTGFMGS